MTREVIQIIVVGVLAMLMCVSSDYTGLSFKLTRSDDDKFKNPVATTCDWQTKHQKFCQDTNSRCDGNCCQCTCDYQTSTFDSSNMKCQTNNELRKGCKVKFVGKYQGNQIKTLNLQAKKGKAKIYWPHELSIDKVKSFSIINIAFYDDGSEVQTKFLTKSGKVNGNGSNWESEIKWDRVSKDYHGQLFKVNISYTIERNVGSKKKLDRTDCFVFKSSGSITVTFPSANTSTLSPSTTQESTTVSTALSSTSTAPSSTSTIPFSTSTTSSSTMPSSTEDVITTQPSKRTRGTPNTKRPSGNIPPAPSPRTPTNSVEPPVSTSKTIVTTQMKESKKTRKPTEPIDKTVEPSRTEPTVAARNEDTGGGGGNNVVTVSLAVVGCLLLLGVVILVVVWSRRRSARASQEKEKGTVDAKGSANNPVMMSQIESIYAEADNPENYSEKGKNNYVYAYPDGNAESDYTSLDMTKVEGKPAYQSLINAQGNVYEQIPANYENNSSGASGLNNGAPIAEPLYHVVEGQAQEPSEIYHVLEESGETQTREIPGRSGHDCPERIYSTLEEENAPENCNREVSEGTGDDNPDRVYSVLEDENAESDYLTIIPETSDYEQPVNPPVCDA